MAGDVSPARVCGALFMMMAAAVGYALGAPEPSGPAPAGLPRPKADLLLLHGTVLTMDRASTVAEAVAVAGDAIVAVGSDPEIKALAGPATRVIDLQGRTLLPGFIDSRVTGPFGFWELEAGPALVDSGGSPLAQPEEIEARLREWLAAHKPAPYVWVVGSGFDPRAATSKKFDRAFADRAAPDNPLVLMSLDHHAVLLNSRASDLVGLKDMDYPRGSGEVGLDAQRRPTGLVRETPAFLVMNRVWGLLPETARRAATVRFFETASRFGITTVGSTLAVPADLLMDEGLLKLGEMPVRVVAGAFGPNEEARRALEDYRSKGRSPDRDRLMVGPALYPLDGSPIGWGAALFQAYEGAPWTSGTLTMPPEDVDRRIASWAAGRDSLVLEASGSLAVHMILDATERAPRTGERPSLLRADGLQIIAAPDRDRLVRLAERGVVVSLQPTLFPYRVFIEEAIGKERMKDALPYRSLVEAGIPVAINSDWPMAAQTFQPLQIIEWAVTRTGWRPEEALTVEQSLRAYTADAARAIGIEDRVGSIEAGKKADLVVLDRNPMRAALATDSISGIPVRMTLSGGSVVFEDRRAAAH